MSVALICSVSWWQSGNEGLLSVLILLESSLCWAQMEAGREGITRWASSVVYNNNMLKASNASYDTSWKLYLYFQNLFENLLSEKSTLNNLIINL